MSIRVYEFGLLPPTVNATLVDEQMLLAHRYRNKLVELELKRRTAVRAVLGSHTDTQPLADELEKLSAERMAAVEEINVARKKARTRVDVPEARLKAKALGVACKDLRDRLKEAKRKIAADPEIQEKLQAIELTSRQDIRDARAACGTFWPNYLLIEQAHDAARKSKTDPKFQRWSHEGRVSMQLQGGLPVEKMFATDTRIQIVPVDPKAWDPLTRRGDRRRASRTVLRLRVQSDKAKPIWAEWPMIMHREIPPGSVIKVATVSKRYRDCLVNNWRLHLTVEMPDHWVGGRCGEGAVALNLGWWSRDDRSIRAGVLADASGNVHEAVATRSVIDRVEKAESIQGFRDKDMDVMRPLFDAWIRGKVEAVPEWMLEKAVLDKEKRRVFHVGMWRSARRFRAFALYWRDHRFDGDGEGYDLMEAWRARDEHLETYQQGVHRNALGHRKEQYRILAAKLAETYHTLVIDNLDLRVMQRSPDATAIRGEATPHKRNQRHAAGSELRLALINAFVRNGGKVVKVSTENITRCCHRCFTVNDTTEVAIQTRIQRCPNCSESWDIDYNACQNLLRLHRQDQVIAADEVKESRSERLRRVKAAQQEDEPQQLDA